MRGQQRVASCRGIDPRTAERPNRDDIAECVQQVDHVLDTFNALLRIARVESGAHRSAFHGVNHGNEVHREANRGHSYAHHASYHPSGGGRGGGHGGRR